MSAPLPAGPATGYLRTRSRVDRARGPIVHLPAPVDTAAPLPRWQKTLCGKIGEPVEYVWLDTHLCQGCEKRAEAAP